MNISQNDCCVHLDKVSYNYGPIQALKNVSLQILSGELVAILGPNGGGKSTFIKLIARLLKPQIGSITLNPNLKNNLAYLPQIKDIDRNFPLTAYDVVAMGLWKQRKAFRPLTNDQNHAITQAFEAVGLGGFEARPLYALSGGQLQRLLFARLYVQKPDVILLDEPFVGVDHQTTSQLMELIVDWNKQGTTIISVLHDFKIAQEYYKRAIILANDLIAQGDPKIILRSSIENSFFDAALNSVDKTQLNFNKMGCTHD